MLTLHYAPDNASLILRLALEELAVPYRTELVDRQNEAQRSAAYLALNPNGLIPALETPHGVLFETGAALLWLADTYGTLAPAPDAHDRGEFLKWLFFCSNTLHPALRMLFYPGKYVGADPLAKSALLNQVKNNITAHLQVLDRHYPRDRALWCTDFYIACALRWCAIYGPSGRGWFSLAGFPGLRDLVAGLEPRASVSAVIAAEGLGDAPFTAPVRPNPPEGSAI